MHRWPEPSYMAVWSFRTKRLIARQILVLRVVYLLHGYLPYHRNDWCTSPSADNAKRLGGQINETLRQGSQIFQNFGIRSFKEIIFYKLLQAELYSKSGVTIEPLKLERFFSYIEWMFYFESSSEYFQEFLRSCTTLGEPKLKVNFKNFLA